MLGSKLMTKWEFKVVLYIGIFEKEQVLYLPNDSTVFCPKNLKQWMKNGLISFLQKTVYTLLQKGCVSNF